ncbi:MAG: hypothetical protein R6U37_04160 [Dehalococcoidia bacterium]
MTDNNDKNQRQLDGISEADSELALRIATRHLGLAKSVAGRITMPLLSTLSFVPAGLPVLARSLAGRMQWTDTMIERAGRLSDRIQHTVQKSLLPASPIEMAWFRKSRFREDGALLDEGAFEIPEADTSSIEPGTEALASPQRKPYPAGVMAFVSAHYERVQRNPVVAFSPSIMESTGIYPDVPSVMGEGIPGLTSDMPSSVKKETQKAVSPLLPLRSEPEYRQTGGPQENGQPIQKSPDQISARAPESLPRLHEKGLAALHSLISLIPFIPSRKGVPSSSTGAQLDVTSPGPEGMEERGQIDRYIETGAGEIYRSPRENRLLPLKLPFRTITTRHPLRLNLLSGLVQRQPVGSTNLPLRESVLSAAEEEQGRRVRPAMVPEYLIGRDEQREGLPAVSAFDLPETRPVLPKSLAEEIAGRYQGEGLNIPGMADSEAARELPERPEALTGQASGIIAEEEQIGGEVPERSGGKPEEERYSGIDETFGPELISKYLEGEIAYRPIPFVQRSISPDLASGETALTRLADTIRGKYLPAEQEGELFSYETPFGQAGVTSHGGTRTPETVLSRVGAQSYSIRERFPVTVQREFERPEMVLARGRPMPVEDEGPVFREETERLSDEGIETEQVMGGEGNDTEALAREVYSIIKRRLKVEKERAGARQAML